MTRPWSLRLLLDAIARGGQRLAMMKRAVFALSLSLCFLTGAAAQDNPNQPPEHSGGFPNLAIGRDADEREASFEQSPQLERSFTARELLAQRRRLDAALGGLEPQRPGVVDAYVVTIALDSDPVFAREARAAKDVLVRRYDAAGRDLSLAGPDGTQDDLPHGSIDNLLISLARIAEVMDPQEDVLVLYTTSHGLPLGLAYHYGDKGYGILSPQTLATALEDLGIERRILILSACFSGVFVPELSNEEGAVLTAAAAQRSSFGCQPENDWTFYGDALINRAMRQPVSLTEAARAAGRTVAGWETDQRLLASLPQTAIGARVSEWLPELEARMPTTASQPVGRPAVAE